MVQASIPFRMILVLGEKSTASMYFNENGYCRTTVFVLTPYVSLHRMVFEVIVLKTTRAFNIAVMSEIGLQK